MYAQVIIRKTNKETIVTIKPQKGFFFKSVVILFFFPIITLPIITFVLLISGRLRMRIDSFLIIGCAIILIIFVFKHFKKAFGKETITINKNKFAYQNNLFGIGKYFETETYKIKSFKYIGYDQQTKHPLEIKGDALGFATAQGEINYLNQTGTLLLSTEYDVLKFGQDVDEEDFLQIKQLIYQP